MAKPDWITVNPSSGKGIGSFNVTFAENTSTSARSGIVTVKTISGLTHEIQVSQAGKVSNFLQASGTFCEVGILNSTFDWNAITLCISVHLTSGTSIDAGYFILKRDSTQSVSIGDLSLNLEKTAVKEGDKIDYIAVYCKPGTKLGSPPFNYFVGNVEYMPTNYVFGTTNSSQTYPATFKQFEESHWGFIFSTPIPVSGDTTFVYKGGDDISRLTCKVPSLSYPKIL